MRPLYLCDPSLLQVSRSERFLIFFPIIGWWIGLMKQFDRIGRAIEDIDRQLRERTRFPIDEWGGDSARVQRARAIGRVIQTTRDWPNDHFLPSDPLNLLLLEEEGMGYFEAESDIEEQCGLTYVDEVFYDAVLFADLVDLARPMVHDSRQ